MAVEAQRLLATPVCDVVSRAETCHQSDMTVQPVDVEIPLPARFKARSNCTGRPAAYPCMSQATVEKRKDVAPFLQDPPLQVAKFCS